jgi:hypothetical protein
LKFSGSYLEYGEWKDGKAVTIDTTMTEADFSGKKLGAAGAQILAAFMSTELFEAKGALSKLTFCGCDQHGDEGDAVTIDTTMTEADFSGKKLGAAGAQVLAAFMSTKLFEAKGSLSSLNILKNNIGEQAQALIKIKHEKKMITLCGLKCDETELNLSGKMRGAADALVLADEIKDMGSLVSLSLAENGLGVEGAKHIAEVLPKW